MRASLEFLADRRAPFALDVATVTLGRHPECELVLPSDAVSRRHARIVREAGGFLLQDLGSRNGTLLNGHRIGEPVRLRDSDVVRMCDVELRFRSGEDAAAHVQVTDTVLAQPEIVSTLLANTAAVVGCQVEPQRALRAVLDITRELAEGVELERLLPRVLDHVFALFPQADQGAILLESATGGELNPSAVRLRHDGDQLQISRTVVERAMQRREAVLSQDAAADAQFEPSQSLLELPIRSLMCVPMLGRRDRPLGVIELHSAKAGTPFSRDCLDILVTVANAAGIAVENARLHRALLEQDRLERDLQHAREVQRSFLPRRLPQVQGYGFFAHYQAAQAVGGDYYGFHPLGEGQVALGLGDVSGKGLPAALWMARLSSDVRYALTRTDDPASALALVNRELLASAPESRFVTFVLLVLDPRRHRLRFATAGHPPPLLRAPGGQVEELHAAQTGVPLNVTDQPELLATTGVVELEPGASVLLYSDGVSEALGQDGSEFGEAGIRRSLAAPDGAGVPAVGERLVQALEEFRRGQPVRDDTTLLCVGRDPA